MKAIHLSNISVRLPGLSGMADLAAVISGERKVPGFRTSKQSDGRTTEFGELIFEEGMAHYPQRQDAKIMRSDVLAATICAGELMINPLFEKVSRKDIPLYISGGNFVEQVFTQNEKLLKYLKQTIRIEDERRRMETLYKIVPPLLALNTLTNAASSYIAQYTQVAGHNATLGNTSISGAYALRSACQELNDHPEVVIAGASNSGGFYSYITLSRFFDPSHRWRESSGAVMFALTSGNEVSGNNDKPIAIIEDIRFSSSIPSVFNNARFDQLEEGTTIDPDSMIVFSGAYTDDIYRQQKELFENLSDECFSWFPYLGNVGSVTPLLNILAAALKLRSSKHERAVCIDKDPFGRESRITIKLAG